MKRIFMNFMDDESGAVSVDWVVLAASMVAFGLAITAIIQTGAINGVINMFASVDAAL
ncbi:hypothetical protein [Yoonia sp. 208BN28-4]|uniref:hypothetical protein n=1 Tax=Yoonia sp. 208BN28-4 TaxID=3126505 RepID=UPI0030A4C4D9